MGRERIPQGRKPCPPADPRRYIHVEAILPGKEYVFAVWSEFVFGVELEWNGQRTVLRVEQAREGRGRADSYPAHWYGLLTALVGPHWAPRGVMVTAGAWRNSPTLQAADGQLRGRRLVLTRMGRSRNSPMKAWVDPEGRRQTFPPLPEVCEWAGRLYGVELS